MNISKFSRGFIVLIFTFLIAFLVCFNVYISLNNVQEENNILSKVLYIVTLVVLISVYSLLKEKLSKKNVNKKKSIFIRYSSLIVVVFILKLLISVLFEPKFKMVSGLIFTTVSVVTSIILKKIIYNISKSDSLSAVGMLMFLLLPNMSSDFIICFNSYVIMASIMFVIMFMQKLIDELKQPGIKNKKYIIYSIIIGIFIGICMIFGVNSLVWIVVGIVTLFVTQNLDRTHINFSNKFINNLRQKNKELLYRLERIYINKIFIAIVVIAIIAIVVYFEIGYFLYNILDIDIINEIMQKVKISNNVWYNIDCIANISIPNLLLNIEELLSHTQMYSIILGIYIIIIEILNVVLRRKYDTKSTIIKCIFLCIMFMFATLGLNQIIYAQVLQVFLILIAIINTTNLYLNRDERVKLLNA